MQKFWNITNSDEGRVIRFDGPIAEETWWGDEITPQMFKNDLEADEGDVIVNINSPGGDVFAAAQIYNMLRAHKGKVKTRIDSLAASAASVIAMAGDEVEISPVGLLMIHNPATIAMGDHKELEKTIATLNEVKESIINAYRRKTHLSRQELSDMMEAETWLNAEAALEKGFADSITGESPSVGTFVFGAKAADKTLVNKIVAKFEGELPSPEEPQPETAADPEPETEETEPTVTDKGTPVTEIMSRLDAIHKLM